MALKLTKEQIKTAIRINKYFGNDLEFQRLFHEQSENYEMCKEIKQQQFFDELAKNMFPEDPFINDWEDLKDFLSNDSSKAVDFCNFSLEELVLKAIDLDRPQMILTRATTI